jgi:hypothetical protein
VLLTHEEVNAAIDHALKSYEQAQVCLLLLDAVRRLCN